MKRADKIISILRNFKNKSASKLSNWSKSSRVKNLAYKILRGCYRMLFANRIIPRLQNVIDNISEDNSKKDIIPLNLQNKLLDLDGVIREKDYIVSQRDLLIKNLSAERDCEKEEKVQLENSLFCRIENIFFYYGGAGNHGCEALFRTIKDICRMDNSNVLLMSYRKHEDIQFGTNRLAAYVKQSILNSSELEHSVFLQGAIAFSVGGDNYCGYPFGTNKLAQYNRTFLSKGVKVVLVGCSIEPEILDNEEVLCDLDSLGLITARESITYDALVSKGITRNTHLIPDSAFMLEPEYKSLPEGFLESKTIGLNFSSVICESGNERYISENIAVLIDYILNQTDFNIAFIPHVVQDFNDDSRILQSYYDKYCATGRVCFVNNQGCQSLKGYIARCRIFVGARTHATIAAYSSYVPTLAIGYSVKSRGIAKDLFGASDNFVVSVQGLKDSDEFKNAFIWILENEQGIKTHLQKTMPEYIKRAGELAGHIEKIRNSKAISIPLANHKECVGCGNCAAVCPTNAATMIIDNAGFSVRNIDYLKCTHCDQCKTVCIQSNNNEQNRPLEFVAAINKNSSERMGSSSGGLFTKLAKAVLAEKGVVYGAAFDEKLIVRHVRVDNENKLGTLRGSKYVESKLGKSFELVKTDLEKGLMVLFSGTPCQIKALRLFLQKDYDNLILVDVICHGVPSPSAFEDRKAQVERREGSEVAEIVFRNKLNGWVDFTCMYRLKNGKELHINHSEDDYMKLFLSNKILRESCYACPANNYRSGSDITLGDYWNGQCKHPAFDDDKGISAVLLNSEKGRRLFYSITGIQHQQADLCWLEKYNHCLIKSVEKPDDWNRFILNNMIPELQDCKVRGPLVSVITSSYNGAQFLDRYFRKMAEQSYNNFEIIFVDDGSTDNTNEIVEKWKSEYERIRETIKITYIWQENGGVAKGYETGLRNVTSEFFTWIDNDDFFAPEYLTENVKMFLNNQQCNIILTNFCTGTLDEDGNYVKLHNIFEEEKVVAGNLFLNAIEEKNFAFARYMIRTACFDKVNPERKLFNSRAGQSWQILLPVLYSNYVYTIDKVLFYYVIRKDSVSHYTQSTEKLLAQINAYEEILNETIRFMHLPEEAELLHIVKEKYRKRRKQLLR